MTAQAWVSCGARRLAVPRAEAFEPPATLTLLTDPAEAVDHALSEPLAAPRLESLAQAASSAMVVIPDASRPCPSAALLRAVLGELRRGGLADERIGILVGCGLHAPTSAAEKRLLVGAEAAARHAVRDSQGLESESVDLGVTSRGAPVRLDRRVAEAGLVVGIGVVEPHLYAGFSGGVKAVAIGCAAAETIAWTHRPAFISEPGVAVGELSGNPFRETLLEIAARSRLGWAVNAVVDRRRPAVRRAGRRPVRRAIRAGRRPPRRLAAARRRRL